MTRLLSLLVCVGLLCGLTTLALSWADEPRVDDELVQTVQTWLDLYRMNKAEWRDAIKEDAILVNRIWGVFTPKESFIAFLAQWQGLVHILLFDPIETYRYSTAGATYALIRTGADTQITWRDPEQIFILEADESDAILDGWRILAYIQQPLDLLRSHEQIPEDIKARLLGIIDREGEIFSVQPQGKSATYWATIRYREK